MVQFKKSILLIVALSAINSPAAAEPAKSNLAQQPAARTMFADSFGLNASERALIAKESAPLSSWEGAWLPTADSFGLNHVAVSAMSACIGGGRAAPKGAKGNSRCIEM